MHSHTHPFGQLPFSQGSGQVRHPPSSTRVHQGLVTTHMHPAQHPSDDTSGIIHKPDRHVPTPGGAQHSSSHWPMACHRTCLLNPLQPLLGRSLAARYATGRYAPSPLGQWCRKASVTMHALKPENEATSTGLQLQQPRTGNPGAADSGCDAGG